MKRTQPILIFVATLFACTSALAQNPKRFIQSFIEAIESAERKHVRQREKADPKTSDAEERTGVQFGIGDLKLGDAPALDRKYSCKPSLQYIAHELCSSEEEIASTRGRFRQITSVLRSPEGQISYVNKHLKPAFFDEGEADQDISNITKKWRIEPKLLKLPPNSEGLTAIIAYWGQVDLVEVREPTRLQLAKGSNLGKGILVDFLNNPENSAKQGFPIFTLSGSRGYVWIASFKANGIGSLRFFAVDFSGLIQKKRSDQVQYSDAETALPERQASDDHEPPERVSVEKELLEAEKAEVHQLREKLAKEGTNEVDKTEALNTCGDDTKCQYKILQNLQRSAEQRKSSSRALPIFPQLRVGRAGQQRAKEEAYAKEKAERLAREDVERKERESVRKELIEAEKAEVHQLREKLAKEGTNEVDITEALNTCGDDTKCQYEMLQQLHYAEQQRAKEEADAKEKAERTAREDLERKEKDRLEKNRLDAEKAAAELLQATKEAQEKQKKIEEYRELVRQAQIDGLDYATKSGTNWEIVRKNNDMTDGLDISVHSKQSNGLGAVAVITGKCAAEGAKFTALIVDDDGAPTIDFSNNISLETGFGVLQGISATVRVNKRDAEDTILKSAAFHNEFEIASAPVVNEAGYQNMLNYDGYKNGIGGSTRQIDIDELKELHLRATSSYAEKAGVWRYLIEINTTRGVLLLKVPIYDQSVRELVVSCESRLQKK